jgi:hypothetical protein
MVCSVDSTFKFSHGRIVITDNAAEQLSIQDVSVALGRHLQGDWGDLAAPNRQDNERGLLEGCRLLSAYQTGAGVRFWIITEPDRSRTTVLLPEDY